MPLTVEHTAELFDIEFARCEQEEAEKTGIGPELWRAGGRPTKAWPNREDRAWWVHHGPGMVDKYVHWREDMLDRGWRLWETPAGLPAIELELMAVFGDVPVKMGIDRVFVSPAGELAVIDLKSGARKPDSNLQLGFYACGMELVLGIRPTYGGYYMARTAELTELVPLDIYSVEQLTGELATFSRAIDNEVFIPNRGSHCKACGVARACSAVGGAEAHLFDPLHPDYGKAKA